MLAVKAKFKCNMKIVRPFENGNFTQVSNSIVNDTRLDLKEKGLMLHILSKPEGWFLNVDEIAKNNRDGKKSIYSGIKKLKELGYISLVNHYENGKIARWEYIVNVNPSIDINNNSLLSQKVEVGFVQVENRHYNNTNSNNTNINNNDDNKTKKNHHEISDLENIENSVIEFADKADIKKTNDFFDEIIFNSGVFNFAIEDKQIKNFKLKIVPKALKENKFNPVLETIKIFPNYVKKTNEGVNPKGKFSEYEMLTYLGTILLSDCKYPKWFNDLYKQEEVQKQVNSLEDSWKSITNIWKAKGNRIDDSIKIMITNIMEFIQDYEYHKKNNLVYDKNLMTSFNTSINQTLSKKSVVEMMDIIKEYNSKNWLSVDPFKKQINSFLNDGLTLETIKSYFDSRGIQ
jgi:hypothetical protein